MPSRIFPRRRRGQLGIESIVWWALFIVFALSISSFVLGFLQGVQPPPTKYFYVFPLAGSGTDVNNGIIGVPQMEKLYNQVRDVSFLLLGIVFMFAALTFVLENFNIMSPGTAWNIIAKSIFYVVMIWLLLWLYNGIAGGVSQLALYFDRLPDGSSAAETIWKRFTSILYIPQGASAWNIVTSIEGAIVGNLAVPIIAIVAFTTAVIVWITSVGRIVILAAAVCALPLALIFDLIPPLKRFADTLFGMVIGLTFSPIIVAIMFNISVPIADAIVCTSSIPLFHILVYGAIISMGSVVIVAFAPMVGSAVSAATTTALSGAGALIASGMMVGQTATAGGASLGSGALAAARAGLPMREALKVGGITGLKGAGTAFFTTGVQVASGERTPSAIGVVTPQYVAGITKQHVQPQYNSGIVALASRVPMDITADPERQKEYRNYAKNFLFMNSSEKVNFLTNAGLRRDQAEMLAETVEANKSYFMEPEHATALGYYLKEGAVAGLLQKETPVTIAHIARAGGWHGTADGLKRSPEERIADVRKTLSSADQIEGKHKMLLHLERHKIQHDVGEYHRVGAIGEGKKAEHERELQSLVREVLSKPEKTPPPPPPPGGGGGGGGGGGKDGDRKPAPCTLAKPKTKKKKRGENEGEGEELPAFSEWVARVPEESNRPRMSHEPRFQQNSGPSQPS
jgi:hypothetical protein